MILFLYIDKIRPYWYTPVMSTRDRVLQTLLTHPRITINELADDVASIQSPSATILPVYKLKVWWIHKRSGMESVVPVTCFFNRIWSKNFLPLRPSNHPSSGTTQRNHASRNGQPDFYAYGARLAKFRKTTSLKTVH
jgi:hypothetical protein